MADVPVNSHQGRRIVVAVDESEESMYALRWCLRTLPRHASGDASEAKDMLVLVYARPMPPPAYSAMDGAGYIFAEEVTAIMDKHSREIADSVMAKATSICKDYDNIKVETEVSVGDARDVICRLVEKLGAELLVMGSHGYGFIKRALLGSVSDHCARNAKCPVLIVKRQAN